MNHYCGSAKIKVGIPVECPYWNPWNALHRRKNNTCISMDGMAEGTTDTESLDISGMHIL